MKYWNYLLHVGFSPSMDYTQQMRLNSLNAFVVTAILLTFSFVVIFTLLGSYSALQGLTVIPVLTLVIYLHSKRWYRLARFLVTYALLALILTLALLDRRTGTEYILIALGCCSVIVFERLIAVLLGFLSAFACYVFYAWYDATNTFIADPTVPYVLVQNSLMFLSGFAVVAQSLAFRALATRYGSSLKEANQQIKSSHEKLKATNEELLALSENLDVLVKKRSAQLQAYINAININLYSLTADGSGTIIKVNATFSEAVGYSNHEMVNMNFKFLNSGSQSKDVLADLLATTRTNGTWRGEVRLRRKDGSFMWIDMVAIPVRMKSETPPYLLLLGLSITERKELEDKNRKAASILESVALRTSENIHEPLAQIAGFTKTLRENPVTKKDLDIVARQILKSTSKLDEATYELTAFVNSNAH